MKRNYFLVASITLLLLSLFGFSDNLFTDIGQESNSDPKFVVHGLFFLAWFVVLVVQANLIRQGDIKSHRRWGLIGMWVALGVVLSTFYIFYVLYEGWSVMPGFVKANRIFTVTFTILVVLAYIKRKQPALHKRFVYIGTIYVMGPVIGRVAEKFGASSDLTYILFEAMIWNALFLSLIHYDRTTLKKIHPITMYGFIWFYIVWIFSIIDY